MGAKDPWDYWEHVHHEQAQGQAGYPQGNVWEHVHHEQAQGQAGYPQGNVWRQVRHEQAQGQAAYPQSNEHKKDYQREKNKIGDFELPF